MFFLRLRLPCFGHIKLGRFRGSPNGLHGVGTSDSSWQVRRNYRNEYKWKLEGGPVSEPLLLDQQILL